MSMNNRVDNYRAKEQKQSNDTVTCCNYCGNTLYSNDDVLVARATREVFCDSDCFEKEYGVKTIEGFELAEFLGLE